MGFNSGLKGLNLDRKNFYELFVISESGLGLLTE
jgi:hypothetical protein